MGVLDVGLSHVALQVTDMDRSVAFYERYANMSVVHRRERDEGDVAWLSDLTRKFVVVLLEGPVSHPLGGFGHLGVGCATKAEVDRGLAQAAEEGFDVLGPLDDGPPVGYWGMIADPDGHNLELAYGQEVGVVVEEARTDD